MSPVTKAPRTRIPVETQPRVRRGYFECRCGQLHVHNAIPPGGGFEEGVPLVCLHDFSGSARVFTRFLAVAGQDRSVYAPDLPGFGESDPPAARPAIADYAAALGDFLDSMRLRQVALVGWRYGALPAIELAVARAAAVKAVILVSVPLLGEAERQRVEQPQPQPPAAEAGFRPPEWQAWAAQAALQYPLRERLARLNQRLLVVRPGDELAESAARIRDVNPGARIAELAQPSAELLASAPERIALMVREFLHA